MEEKDFFDFVFLEIRVSVLEDILIDNPKFRKTYIDTYSQMRKMVLKTKPQEWEALVQRIDAQLLRASENLETFSDQSSM